MRLSPRSSRTVEWVSLLALRTFQFNQIAVGILEIEGRADAFVAVILLDGQIVFDVVRVEMREDAHAIKWNDADDDVVETLDADRIGHRCSFSTELAPNVGSLTPYIKEFIKIAAGDCSGNICWKNWDLCICRYVFPKYPQTGRFEMRINHMRYAIVIEKGDRNYSAYVLDLPGCVATGDTIQDVKSQIQSAIEFHIEAMIADGLDMPAPSSVVTYVDVPAAD